MGHNTSDRKREELAAREAAGERRLAGWRWDGKRLQELATVEGALARGAQIIGGCKTEECRRRVQVDLRRWVRHGFGDLPTHELPSVYRCARVPCAITFQPELYPGGVPLQCYVGREDRISLQCRKCGAGKVHTAEAIIAGLLRSGAGDGNTGVIEVAERVRGPCPACGYPGWIAELKRPPRVGTPDAKLAAPP